MGLVKRGPFVGHLDQNGKGDNRRPAEVDEEVFNSNGAKTFGEDWLLPPVLRRRKEQGEL